MEKLKNFRNSFFILLVISHFFLWEIKLFNINLKFLILFAYIFILLDYKNFLNKFYNYKTLIFLLIFIHLYINAEEFSFYLFKTYFFLFLISCLVIFFKNEILLAFKNSFHLFNILLFLIFIFSIFLTKNYTNFDFVVDFFTDNKILFNENSHFAMISTSIIIFNLNEFLIKKKNIYLLTFLTMILIGYLNFSLTLFAGIFLSCLIIIITNYFSLNKLQITSFILLMLVSITCIYANSISLIKIKSLQNSISKNVDDKEINLSADVFLTSYKIMIKSIKEKPFGYGFNNYNQAFVEHIHKTNYKHKLTPFLNYKDASNNLVKILTELGIYSLIIFYFITFFLFSKKISLSYKLLIIPNFLVQTFFRGAGYFNGGYIICLLLIILFVYEKELKKPLKEKL